MNQTSVQDIYDEYIVYFNIIEKEQFINFTNVNNKNTKLFHNDFIKNIEKNVITNINPEFKSEFFKHHIDLYNENLIDDLAEYKCVFSNLCIFFNALKLNNHIYKHSSLPINKQKKTFEYKRNSETSLFNTFKKRDIFKSSHLLKNSFVESCNKIYVYLYLLMETRLFQYKSVNENYNLDSCNYAYDIKLFINNFYRILSSEFSVYNNNEKKDEFIIILKELINKFIELGNVPLSNICISLLELAGVNKRHIKVSCKSKINYTYLVNPDNIEKAFVYTKERNESNILYNKHCLMIYDKIYETRKEILKNIKINIHPDKNDYIVYNMLQLNTYIENKCFWP